MLKNLKHEHIVDRILESGNLSGYDILTMHLSNLEI